MADAPESHTRITIPNLLACSGISSASYSFLVAASSWTPESA
ncbi:hypothetical protein [Streptomyces sp. NBC_00467]